MREIRDDAFRLRYLLIIVTMLLHYAMPPLIITLFSPAVTLPRLARTA